MFHSIFLEIVRGRGRRGRHPPEEADKDQAKILKVIHFSSMTRMNPFS